MLFLYITRRAWSSVLKASVVECRLIPSINPRFTLTHLDQHVDQHLINTWLTLDWHSIEYAWSKEPSFCGHQDIFTKKYQVFMIPVSLLWKFSNIIFQRSCSLLAGISYFLCLGNREPNKCCSWCFVMKRQKQAW